MYLPPTIELFNPGVRRGAFRAALFDFDGTLSLIREGWPHVMVDLMLDRLREQSLIAEPEPACAAHIEAFVMALNGHPTIRQMERFAQEVVTRGGTPAEPAGYLQQYLDRLMSVVRGRWESLESRRAKPEEWVVPNAHGILHSLQAHGVPLFVASGTDFAHVSREVELLQLGEHIAGRGYAPRENDAPLRKHEVLEAA